MADRRSLLFGLAALPIVAVPVVAVAQVRTDPMVDLYRKAVDLAASVDGVDDDDAANPIMAAWSDVELEAMDMRPASLAGVIAALQWARWEHTRFNMIGDGYDQGAELILAMLDGALGFLKGDPANA